MAAESKEGPKDGGMVRERPDESDTLRVHPKHFSHSPV
jgi:hypothetical protein